LLEWDPDYLFVLDRDSAIGTNGSDTARTVIENAIVQQTSAYRNGHIVYLTPDVWYLAEGGITATDVMLRNLEAGILNE
jgi:iron complex transport system substrate-binding protein